MWKRVSEYPVVIFMFIIILSRKELQFLHMFKNSQKRFRHIHREFASRRPLKLSKPHCSGLLLSYVDEI